MRLMCDLNSPCPSQKTVDGKDICIKEEGKCEYQRLEEPNQCEKDNCAWCKIDVNIQPKFKAENWPEKKCSCCGSWNDIGQQKITMNSLKQIYDGCLKLMQYVAETCGEILEAADIDFDKIKETLDMDKRKPLSIDVGTWQIVKMLFLMNGSSGGTSTGNLTHLLDLKKESVSFLLEKYKMCSNTECPYYKEDEICEAIEGCAGNEGATEI